MANHQLVQRWNKHTKQLDYFDATPVDMTLDSVFGLGDNDGTITLE